MRLYCRTLEGRQDPADASRRQLGSQTETRITEGTASALYTYSKMCVCVCGCKIVHMRVQIHSPTDKITLRLHSSRVNSYSLPPVPLSAQPSNFSFFTPALLCLLLLRLFLLLRSLCSAASASLSFSHLFTFGQTAYSFQALLTP